MELITHLLVWGVGLITGMYFVTQIESHIKGNVQNNKLIKNMENYEQKKCKKQSKASSSK